MGKKVPEEKKRKPVDYIIGIDPGVNSGLAIVSAVPPYKLILTHRHKLATNDMIGLHHVLGSLAGPWQIPGNRGHLCIEDQFVGQNKRSAIKLAVSRGRWIEACMSVCDGYSVVTPSQWQSKELNGVKGRELLKKMASAKVAALYNITVTHDEADAVLIARYCAIKGVK